MGGVPDALMGAVARWGSRGLERVVEGERGEKIGKEREGEVGR